VGPARNVYLKSVLRELGCENKEDLQGMVRFFMAMEGF